MTPSRRLSGLLALLAIVLGPWLSASSLGQDDEALAMEIITAESLTGQQRNMIDTYVARHAGQILEGQPAQLATARQMLVAPWDVEAATSTFRQHYRQSLAEHVDAALASDSFLVRLNGAILAARIRVDLAEPRLDAILADESAAVRYWAARALREQAASGQLGAARQEALAERLRERIDAEGAPAVLEQLLVAMATLPLQHAGEPLLEALNARAARHAEQPGQSVQPEHAAMQQLYRRLIEADDAPAAASVQLSRAAVRYMDLLAATLADADEEFDEPVQQQYAQCIELADHILRTLHRELGGAGGAPGAVTSAVEAGDWDAVRTAAQRWRNLLQQPPYNLDEAALAI